MERIVSHGATYITYTYTEQELKDMLEIDEHESILAVERHTRSGEWIVRLIPE